MYTAVKVAKLSPAVLSKMLNGHAVRIKSGSDLELHLSPEQLKKHKRASAKGKAHTIMMDPFQISQHLHLKRKRGGRLLVDEPITGRQVADAAGSFLKDPKGMLGLGKKRGGRLLVDEPVTGRQVVDAAGSFLKNPKGMLGLGRKKRGGRLLVDEPVTGRQVVDAAGSFLKDPKGMLGFGMSGKGPLEDFGKMLEVGFNDKIAVPLKKAGKQIKRGGEKLGKETASVLIHQGIPLAASAVGSTVGSALTGGPIGGIAGSQAGKMAGKELADYVGQQTGYGFVKARRRRGGALFPAGVR